MSNNINKFTQNIIYRSNIFNYDTKFFEEFSKGPQAVDPRQFRDNTFGFSADNISKFNSYLTLPIKDQLQNFNSLVELLNESEEDKKLPVHKDAKVVVNVLLDILSKSCISFTKQETDRLEKQKNWSVEEISSAKQNSDGTLFNILYCLLFLDGLIMNNIDLSVVFDLLAVNVGTVLVDLLFSIIENKYIQNIHKEIASHILSAIVVFTSNPSEEHIKKLIDWTITYNESSERKRDNCFTSNLCLILSNDIGIRLFVEEFKSKRSLNELFTILTKDYSINTVYEAFLCIWNITNYESYYYLFENREFAYVEKILQVIKTNKVEKIIRIGSLIIKNILSSEKCSEILIDFQFVKTVKNLLSNKWSDDIIKEELSFICDYLEKNNKFVK